MIVFLNGAFGVGKTSAARFLHAALPGSVVFDPEWVGSMLMATLGDREDWPLDYQLLPAWRRIVVATVHELRCEYDETLIVPMTVLTATEATLRARIVGRPEDEGPHDWSLRHMPTAIAALQGDEYGTEIPTDERTPEEIGAAILSTL